MHGYSGLNEFEAQCCHLLWNGMVWHCIVWCIVNSMATMGGSPEASAEHRHLWHHLLNIGFVFVTVPLESTTGRPMSSKTWVGLT